MTGPVTLQALIGSASCHAQPAVQTLHSTVLIEQDFKIIFVAFFAFIVIG